MGGVSRATFGILTATLYRCDLRLSCGELQGTPSVAQVSREGNEDLTCGSTFLDRDAILCVMPRPRTERQAIEEELAELPPQIVNLKRELGAALRHEQERRANLEWRIRRAEKRTAELRARLARAESKSPKGQPHEGGSSPSGEAGRGRSTRLGWVYLTRST
jgi:hypothetical protein